MAAQVQANCLDGSSDKTALLKVPQCHKCSGVPVCATASGTARVEWEMHRPVHWPASGNGLEEKLLSISPELH